MVRRDTARRRPPWQPPDGGADGAEYPAGRSVNDLGTASDHAAARTDGPDPSSSVGDWDQPYRLLVEQMRQGAATLDSKGVVVYANPALQALIATNVTGRPLTDFFPAEEAAAVRALAEDSSTRPCALETRALTADGREVPVCLTVTDITDQKRYQALETTFQHFRTLGDSSPVPMWVLDPDGAVQFVNRAYTDFFGTAADDAAGAEWTAHVHPEDAPRLLHGFRLALESRREFRAEARMRRADGEWRWVAAYAAPWYSPDGEFLGYVGTGPDVTQMKRVEGALRESEERFRLATEALQGVVYDWDAASGSLTRSPGMADVLGSAEPESGNGVAWWKQQVHPEDLDRCLATFAAAAAAGAPAFDIEYRVRHRDGHYFWAWDHGRILYDEHGRVRRLTGCMISIDAQKRLEEALKRADADKDRFLATLAHELRNPLAPIRNAVAVLKARAPAAPELRWGHELIDRQVEHMARLLDDLLDVCRITQNKLKLRRQQVELRSVVETALETSRPLIESHRHELTVTLPAEPVYLDADAVRLSQAFANLLNNAAKYTDPGGRLSLTAERRGGELTLSFRDTGIGISREALPGLFQIFSQAAPAMERSEGGLGIGLSLVRGLVELHGGTVEAHSEGPGRGSTFVVRLPVSAAVPAATSPPPRPRAAAGLRILVADDNRDTAESLSLVLSLCGHEVRTAFDGEEATRVAEQFRPDVALLDLGMPKASGHEVARRIREQPWGRDVLLIAQTGWGQDDDQRRTREAGFDHHLVKPVAPATITDLLGRARPRL
jgi:PAS domain S-box-containing protein